MPCSPQTPAEVFGNIRRVAGGGPVNDKHITHEKAPLGKKLMIVIVFAATCASSVPVPMPVFAMACAVRAFSAAPAFLLAGRHDKHTAPGGRHVESVFALEEQLRRRNGRLAQPSLQHLAAERQHFAYPRRIDEHPAAAPVLPQKEIQQFVCGVAVKMPCIFTCRLSLL